MAESSVIRKYTVLGLLVPCLPQMVNMITWLAIPSPFGLSQQRFMETILATMLWRRSTAEFLDV